MMPHEHFRRSDGGFRAWLVVAIAALVASLIALAKPGAACSGACEAQASGPAPSNRSYVWRPVAIGGGGFITGYSSDLSGKTRVVRTDVYGAYLWQADLDRWTQLVTTASMPAADHTQGGMDEGVYAISVAPSDPSRLYMAVKGRVYRSADLGMHWTLPTVKAPPPLKFDPNSEFRHYGSFLAVSPSNPDLVLLGTPGQGVWRSTDGGLGWSRISSLPANAPLRSASGQKSPGAVIWFERGANGTYSGRIWVMVAGVGMFVSGDNGKTFSPLPSTGPKPTTIKRGDFAPDGTFYGVDIEGRKVWAYRRHAWEDLTHRAGLPARAYAAVAVDQRDGRIFVFDEGSQIFRSADKGTTWSWLPHRSIVGRGDPPWLRVSNQSYFAIGNVQFDPVKPDRLWASAGTGVYFADVPASAAAVTWTSQARGIEELVTSDIIQPPGGVPLFAAWDFGIHRKENPDAYSTTYGPKERVLISAQQMDWSAADPKFIVTNASDARTCCAEDGDAVLAGYSLDGGRTWKKFATLPTPPGTAASDPWRMAFGTIAVSAGDTENIVWEPAFNRSPFYTKDRGRHWRRVVLEGEHLPLTGSFPELWMPRKTLAADRVRGGVFYLVHSGDGANPGLAGLWRTEDGGDHWQQVFKGEITPGSGFAAKLRAVPGKAGHLFFTPAIVHGAGINLMRSVDAGVTWSAVPNVTHVADIAFGKEAPGAGYPTLFIAGRVSGDYGIWRSTDNAASWRKIGGFPLGSLDLVKVIEADKDVFGRVYLGYQGSGWSYGLPSNCTPAPYRPSDSSQCVAVQ